MSQASFVLGVVEAPGNIATFNRLITGDLGVRSRRPQAVR